MKDHIKNRKKVKEIKIKIEKEIEWKNKLKEKIYKKRIKFDRK